MSKFSKIFETRERTAKKNGKSDATRSGPGRPSGSAGGKRSDPDYTQITAYIRKDTRRAIKQELATSEDQDFSELIEELLGEWLKSRT